jgi:phage terminase large subunit
MLIKLAGNSKILILCLREIQNSINDSVYRLLVNIIYELGDSDNWTIGKTEIVHNITGSRFIFKGLYRNVASIKSLEGVDIAWIEEGQTVSQESLDLLIPTIRKDGSEIWVTFNPDQEEDPVYSMFVEKNHPKSIVKKVNYPDNPFFPDTLREEMEYTRKNNPEKWEWVWNGSCRKETEAQIFKGKYKIEPFEEIKDPEYNHGMDFGFAEDPSCVIQNYIHENKLYITREAYGLHVTNDDLPEMILSVSPGQDWPVMADNARPETIDYIRRHGYRGIRPCKKWKGSVEDGIEYLKSFEEIIIHPRCKHTIEEFRLYSYKVNKHTGEIMPVPEDKNNHIMDALRYSIGKRQPRKMSVTLY